VGPTITVGRKILMVLVAALLLLAAGGTVHAPSADSRSTAMRSMSFLIGKWQCHEHIVGGTDRAFSMVVTTALADAWMKAETEYPAVGSAPAWREEFYWTYIPLTMSWTLDTFDSGGNYGDFGATWWKGPTIDWHGRQIVMGHMNDQAIEWTKSSSARVEIREYDSDAAGHLASLSSATSCGKAG
jgi:hypothetical protein